MSRYNYEPRGLPPELLKYWKKHKMLADKYEDEHESYGFGERYYNLWQKHECVCDAIASIEYTAELRDELSALKDRVRALPSDWDENGNATEVVEGVRRLKSDLARGAL